MSGKNVRVSRILIFAIALAGMSAKAADLPKGDCAKPAPHQDFRHCDFSGAQFPGADLTGALLDGV